MFHDRLTREAILDAAPPVCHAMMLEAAAAALAIETRRSAAIAGNARRKKARQRLQHAPTTRQSLEVRRVELRNHVPPEDRD